MNKLTVAYLENAYEKYNRKDFIHPDPVEFLWRYESPADREVVGIIASSFALGRATCIIRVVGEVLERLERPSKAVVTLGKEVFEELFKDFRYRFYTGTQLAGFLHSLGRCIRKYGSLEECFLVDDDNGDTFGMLSAFLKRSGLGRHGILPDPEKGSACKRLHLFLRWMIRQDEIDPGGWDFPSSRLIVPVDTHMLKAGRALSFTSRKQPDAVSAREITDGFRRFAKDDPVRYDFSITRMGIRDDLDLNAWLDKKTSP